MILLKIDHLKVTFQFIPPTDTVNALCAGETLVAIALLQGAIQLNISKTVLEGDL